MVTDHDMRMEALRLFEENERLKKALEKVKYALCKNSFCDAEKIESALKVTCETLAICQCSPNEDPSGQRREATDIGWMGDIGGNPYGPFDR